MAMKNIAAWSTVLLDAPRSILSLSKHLDEYISVDCIFFQATVISKEL